MKTIGLIILVFLIANKPLYSQNVGIGTENPQGEFHVTKPAPDVEVTFTGSGLDDLLVDQSGFTGEEQVSYYIKVENAGPVPNLFQWSNDGINYSASLAMSTNPIELNNGILISFQSTSGHTYNDMWNFSISPAYPDGLIVKNGKVGIGTTDPNSKLEINGAINIGNKLGSYNAGDIRFDDRSGDFEGYDGENWYSLTGKEGAYIPADTSGAMSYNMTTDFNNPIYVSDSSGYIYDDGGPGGDAFGGGMDIYLVNSAPKKAIALQLEIENQNNGLYIYVGSESNYTAPNVAQTVRTCPQNDTIRLWKYSSTPQDYSGFKITYQFLYSETDSIDLPSGKFPFYFVKSKAATLGGDFLNSELHLDSIGITSIQFGHNTKAKGEYSMAAGYYSRALGTGAVSIGEGTVAEGYGSVALGSYSYSKGNTSFAAGYFTSASGAYSNALGSSSKAFGIYSTAIGYQSEANNVSSMATGYRTQANADYTTVLGKYNVGLTNSLFEIGYGEFNNKKNALTIKDNGYLGTKDVTQPLANLHLKYANDGWNSHLRMDYNTSDYGVIVYDWDGFKIRTFGSGDHIIFRNSSNVNNAEFYDNGNAWLRGTLTQNSDRNLKQNISVLSSSLINIMKIGGYHYHWKESSLNSKIQTGVLAQEVLNVFPELVEENSDGYLSVNYIGLIPHLIEGVKELKLDFDKKEEENKYMLRELKLLRSEVTLLKEQMENFHKD